MMIRILAYLALGGLPMSLAATGGGHVLPFYFAGVLISAALLPVALYGPKSFLGQLAVIAPFLWVVNSLCLWTESLIFLPALRAAAAQTLLAMTVMNLTQALTLAGLSMGLRAARNQARAPVSLYAMPGGLWRIGACAIAYAIYYLLFGYLTYRFFTHAYYPEAREQVAAIGVWFWPIQFGRGLLMTLAVWSIVATLRLSRGQSAVAIGIMLWVAGGLAPLLLPNPYFGLAQRVYHIAEIFTQNFTLGITVCLLLRRIRPQETLSAMAAVPPVP